MRHADATVDFYGDGHSRADLEALTHELGLDKRVRFMGTRSRRELYDALPGYDVAPAALAQRSASAALAEPMAAGVPVVASNLPGPSEVLSVTPTASRHHRARRQPAGPCRRHRRHPRRLHRSPCPRRRRRDLPSVDASTSPALSHDIANCTPPDRRNRPA